MNQVATVLEGERRPSIVTLAYVMSSKLSMSRAPRRHTTPALAARSPVGSARHCVHRHCRCVRLGARQMPPLLLATGCDMRVLISPARTPPAAMVGAATGAVLAVVRRQSMPVYVVGMFVNYGVFGGLFFSEPVAASRLRHADLVRTTLSQPRTASLLRQLHVHASAAGLPSPACPPAMFAAPGSWLLRHTPSPPLRTPLLHAAGRASQLQGRP